MVLVVLTMSKVSYLVHLDSMKTKTCRTIGKSITTYSSVSVHYRARRKPYGYCKLLNVEMVLSLCPLARVLLCPYPSSVDSEQAFSSAAYLNDTLRGRVNDEGIADLALVRDWALSVGPICVYDSIRDLLRAEEIDDKMLADTSSGIVSERHSSRKMGCH